MTTKIKNYPVPVGMFTKEAAPYVYTEYGEAFAAARQGLEPRTAGTVACFAGEPLQDGITASAWVKAGFVRRR